MTDVVMPQMGESIVEGTLTKWLKKPGDRVERDEPLFEISTDKVDTEIPSPAAGVLAETLVEEGKTVGINTVVARINEGDGAGAAAAAPAAEAAPATPSEAPAPPPEEPAEKEGPAQETIAPTPAAVEAMDEESAAEAVGPISPLVRRMARENDLDLSKVRGTGAGGRITKQDVENYLARQKPAAAAPQPQAPAAAPVAPPKRPAEAAPATPAPAPTMPAPAAQARTRVEPMSTMRSKIAEHMILSKRTSAHVTTVHKVDMTKVAKMRDRHKADFQQRYGISLTYLPFVARAAVEGLREFPLLNASIEGSNIIYHNEINIGIAVALENGLIVPVIRNSDERNVLGLQRAIVDLSTRARSRQLKPEEVQGGTFSITNFGSFGSVFATPVINQPQVAILGVGTVQKEPVVIDDAIAIRSVCFLALTFDHRLIDGALADQYTGKVKSVLENWSEEVL
ncbi:MAG TPA: 2-oxoglutarate dehydrogenase, E2 component, dihydrolipoamide succinyltransferase [Bryobacteraceae bacterium]|nr:2-oxoglutarate dehydrogenase, E2 component, dihydrolipoamide succinyltransferase [Bryobacteraceae bacterium]